MAGISRIPAVSLKSEGVWGGRPAQARSDRMARSRVDKFPTEGRGVEVCIYFLGGVKNKCLIPGDQRVQTIRL